MKKIISTCLLVFLSCGLCAEGRSWSDYVKSVRSNPGVSLDVQADRASVLAAGKIVEKIQASGFSGKRIVFLPLSEDTYGFSDIIGAQLNANPGRYEFYTRDKAEWKKLLAEYDLADPEAEGGGYDDLFDPEAKLTIKDAALKSAEAIVTGKLRGLSIQADGKVIVTMTFAMTDIKTMRKIVSGYIDVTYPEKKSVQTYENYSPELISAIEDAAYKFSSEVLNKGIDVGRIALLPFENDAMNISELLQNELARTPGLNDFYVRGDKDWSKLNKERAFSGGQADLLKSETVASLVELHGVKAVISGKILHVPVKGADDVRVSFTARLINVETGAVVFAGSVTGEHKKAIVPKPISRPLRKALGDAGNQLLSSLKSRFPRDRNIRVYLTPFSGVKPHAQKYLKPYITGAKSRTLSFFDLSTTAAEKSLNNRIGEQLANSSLGSSDFARILSQLDEIDKLIDGDIEGGVSSTEKQPKIVRAVLTGDILTATEGELVAGRYESTVTISFDVKSLKTGELLWTETITGEYQESDKEYNYRIEQADKIEADRKAAADEAVAAKKRILSDERENKLIDKVMDNLGLTALAILGFFFLLFFISKVTRSR